MDGYLRQLERRPMGVKAFTSATTFSQTDALAQAREAQARESSQARKPYDVGRTGRNGLFGLFWLGP